MSKQIGKIWMAMLLLLVFAVGVVSYRLGEASGTQLGFTEGYARGQIDFAMEIHSALNETIDANSEPQTYRYFKDVKDITLYVVTRNGIRTIAIWKGKK